MTERPILFRGEMVRAILAGQKTQTRRIVNTPKPNYKVWLDEKTGLYFTNISHNFGNTTALRNPYGNPGDRLWVRETFTLQCECEGDQPPFNDGRPVRWTESEEYGRQWLQPHYKATDPEPELECTSSRARDRSDEPHAHWKPSIHMPRWACRLVLEIASIRVERLQDISEADAKAEGVQACCTNPACYCTTPYRHGFNLLWEKIHGAESWNANQWLWVIEFRPIPQTTPEVSGSLAGRNTSDGGNAASEKEKS